MSEGLTVGDGGVMSETPEHRLRRQKKDLRELVASRPDFQEWISQWPTVRIDQETLWVVGGDQLKDLDQLVMAWARRFQPGLLTESDRD
ncbi:hypothetical protein [Nonomuraea sp. KM90]|uniref:hypothetical protein n=1 Tax=Nonomuraea sp. KM90 TaxID=3457428 RepID=UPI003FCD1A59